ncbi:ras family domain-containing protein [Ditylenchus destructor]|uniref:Ras family domain-containing protein n=1 Tax=Ditylenchus destructor TaxID=166010 RepID=A0AAD4MM52_9BILA|nr:ras family domain-containing protein [Ditylenchus destructor]
MDISTSEFYPMFHYQYRIILIGDSTVGKSSLLRYFTEGKSAEISDPTVGVDFYARMVEIKPNYRIKLQLWDTAGQEKFKSITRSYYRNSVGVIVVYDITNRRSFDHVQDWLSEAEANIGGPDPSQCVFLLVGHKADLDAKREVLYEEGEYLAKYRKVKFVETSALSGENVNEAFTMVARDINARFESGALRLCDGWEGIKSGLMRSQSITLSDISQDAPSSNCAC